MPAEFKHMLRRLRWQIIGWSFGVVLYDLLLAFFYPSMADMGDAIIDYIKAFPQGMVAFFENIYAIATPMGYLDVYFFSYMHLIIGILAIGTGAGLLAGDEERGTLDLVMAQPVSRSELFWGRWTALLAAFVIILAVGWLSWALPSGSIGLDLTWTQLLLPFLPLLAVLMLFASLALLLSMILPAARIAGMVTGALLVGNYLLMGLANLNEKLRPVMEYTPLHYYQGGTAVEGLEVCWLLGLLAGTLLVTASAWLLFLRRDIRVGGERSWKLK